MSDNFKNLTEYKLGLVGEQIFVRWCTESGWLDIIDDYTQQKHVIDYKCSILKGKRTGDIILVDVKCHQSMHKYSAIGIDYNDYTKYVKMGNAYLFNIDPYTKMIYGQYIDRLHDGWEMGGAHGVKMINFPISQFNEIRPLAQKELSLIAKYDTLPKNTKKNRGN